MRRLLSAMYVWSMRLIAPAFGLDRWDISTSGGDYGFRRFNVTTGKWENRGLPPDGYPDTELWLLSAPGNIERAGIKRAAAEG